MTSVKDVGELRAAIAALPDELPLKVAVGKGRVLAPAKALNVMVQAIEAGGYYVLHNDPESTEVLAIVEDPRLEPPI